MQNRLSEQFYDLLIARNAYLDKSRALTQTLRQILFFLEDREPQIEEVAILDHIFKIQLSNPSNPRQEM